jgi:cation/acetate symporter
VACVVAGYFGINPPAFVAQVVAFAFGLAASSFFPVIILGIFDKRMNDKGAIAGMLTGLIFTIIMIGGMRSVPLLGTATPMIPPFFGINAEGIGTVGMILNFIVSFAVSRSTPPPPKEIQDLIENLRLPTGAGQASAH